MLQLTQKKKRTVCLKVTKHVSTWMLESWIFMIRLNKCENAPNFFYNIESGSGHVKSSKRRSQIDAKSSPEKGCRKEPKGWRKCMPTNILGNISQKRKIVWDRGMRVATPKCLRGGAVDHSVRVFRDFRLGRGMGAFRFYTLFVLMPCLTLK